MTERKLMANANASNSGIDLQTRIQMFFSTHITPPRLHRFVYQLTGGVIGSRMPTVSPGVLLLTDRGRTSGKARTTPLISFPIGERIVVAASNNGKDQDPEWYLNLREALEAEIQRGDERIDVSARVALGNERERLWDEITTIHPLFAAYQQKTDRQIPIVILERRQ